jgi:hypothetical protein
MMAPQVQWHPSNIGAIYLNLSNLTLTGGAIEHRGTAIIVVSQWSSFSRYRLMLKLFASTEVFPYLLILLICGRTPRYFAKCGGPI